MRNPKKTIAAGAMVAALAGGGLLGATLGSPLGAGAQDDTTTTTAPADGTAPAEGQRGPGGRGGHGGFDLEVAASTLNLTTDELRTQLQEGKTLAEVAEAQGVDKQTLIDALVAEGEARLDEAAAELPDRIAEMVDSTMPARGGMGEGGPGCRGGPGGRGGGPGLEAAAEALGVTTDELHTAIHDGQTIAEIAADKGVDKQAVIDAMVAEAKEHTAEAVADGKITQEEADERLAEVTERITTMVDEGMPDRPNDGD